MSDAPEQPPRCLMVVYRLPWPPAAGGSLRDWQNVTALATRTRLSVIALTGAAPPRPHVELQLWTSLDDELLREPAPYDGTETVLQQDWWKNDLGFPSDYAWTPFRAAALRRLLNRHAFDFSVIEDVIFWRYAEIARRFMPIVIDYHNVQSRVEEGYLACIPAADVCERERAAIGAQSMRSVENRYRNLPAIVCSEAEKAALVERGFERDDIAVVHNTVDVDSVAIDRAAKTPAVNPRILFAGMMDYLPNAQAALELIEDIFPRVRGAVTDAELWIAGMSPMPELLLAVRGTSQIYVTGQIAETEPYFRSASVLSVPLRLGGGTRFKILEAFKYGLPVVTSPKGCEGLDVIDRHHALIAHSAAEHADSIIRILQDHTLADCLAAAGAALVREKYSFATAGREWDDCLRRFRLLGGTRTWRGMSEQHDDVHLPALPNEDSRTLL